MIGISIIPISDFNYCCFARRSPIFNRHRSSLIALFNAETGINMISISYLINFPICVINLLIIFSLTK